MVSEMQSDKSALVSTLALVELAINNNQSSITLHSLAYLMFGQHLRLFIAVALERNVHLPVFHEFTQCMRYTIQQVQGQLIKKQEYQAKYANRCCHKKVFYVGEQMLLSTKNLKITSIKKFRQRFIGLCKVVERNSNVSYSLDLPARLIHVHLMFYINFLMRYTRGKDRKQPPKAVLVDGKQEQVIEKIVDEKL